MNLPLGTRVKELCSKCKQNITGIVTKKNIVSFTCPHCSHEWKLNLIESKGKGSRFSEQDLKDAMERNKHLKIKD